LNIANVRNLEPDEVVSRDSLDDLSKIGDLPIRHEHATWPHAHVSVQEDELSAFLRDRKVFRVVCGHVVQHVPRRSG